MDKKKRVLAKYKIVTSTTRPYIYKDIIQTWVVCSLKTDEKYDERKALHNRLGYTYFRSPDVIIISKDKIIETKYV